MSRLFYHVCQDNAGNLLLDVSGTMRLAGSGTLATIYGDEALTVPIANPMTNHPSFGSFKCFLGAGDYDFYMAKSGYTFETLTGVQGHGTMAQQDASAVAISGGSLTGISGVSIGTGIVGTYPLEVAYNRAGGSGVAIQPNADTGGGNAILFLNAAPAQVGAISTTATATAYATSSDARLKHAITPLAGALAVVQALRPVAFRWRSNDEPGHGFLASEVEDVVPGVITGTRDAVDEEGRIVPQMMDMSKLVPYLTAALQETLAQVQALTARVVSLEGARGV